MVQSSMGNSLSLSGPKEITGKQLELSSKEISTMSNELFRFMYTSWKPKDVWDIAENPDKYVIAISDMITTQFHVLGYKTRDKRMGEIYFRKWDDLEPPMGSDSTQMAMANSRNDRRLSNVQSNAGKLALLKKEIKERKRTRRQRAQAGFPIQKQNAEIIAFYFVRIFQILGAMLLVVKDIDLPSYGDDGEPTGKTSLDQKRDFAQGFYPSQVGVSGFKPSSLSIDERKRLEIAEAALRASEEKKTPVATMAGGGNFDTKIALGPYEFLRYYLRKIDENDKMDFANNGITIPSGNVYMLDKSRLLFFRYTQPKDADKINLKNGVEQEFGLPVKEGSSSTVEIVFVKVKVEDLFFSTKTSVGIKELLGYKSPVEYGSAKKDLFPTDITISFERRGGERSSSVRMKRDETTKDTLDYGMPYYIIDADNNILDHLRGRYDPRSDFSIFLEQITLFYLVRKNNNLRIITLKEKTNSTNDDELNSITQTLKHPKMVAPTNKSLEGAFTELNNTKSDYRPHCVARALQLLDSASISDDKFTTGYAKSGVCKSSLGSATGKTSLSDYLPTRSVGQLYGKVNPTDYTNSMKVLSAFVQKGSTGIPVSVDDASKFPGEKDDLQSAIQRLATAFKVEYKDQKSFSEITSDIPTSCNSDKGKEIKIDRQSQGYRDMKSASRQLLAYHLKSIIEISKFLKKIFNISQRGDGTWAVEGPKVELLFAGYDTLNTLTNQARAILIDYYSGCEEIYQRGLEKWQVETRKAAVDTSKEKEGVLLPSASKPVAALAPAPGAVPPPVDTSVKPTG